MATRRANSSGRGLLVAQKAKAGFDVYLPLRGARSTDPSIDRPTLNQAKVDFDVYLPLRCARLIEPSSSCLLEATFLHQCVLAVINAYPIA